MQLIPISNIHYVRSANASRSGELFKSDKDFRNLCQSLGNGWTPPSNTNGWVIVTDADAKMKKLAQVEREAELARLMASDTRISLSIQGKTVDITESAEVADAYRAMYFITTQKTKKSPAKTTVLTINFEGCTGYRRNSALPYVNAGLLKSGQPMILEVPALPTQFGSELERLEAVIGENTMKSLGARPLEIADMLYAGWKLWQAAAKQIVFRMHWKDGMGQKIHAICQAQQAYFDDVKDPDDRLDVLGYLSANPDKFRSVRHGLLKDKVKVAAPSDEIAEYIHSPKAGQATTAKPQMAPRTDIEAMASQHAIQLVRFVHQSVLANDVQQANRFNAIKEQLNAAIDQTLVENNIPLPWGEAKAVEPTSA